MSRPGVRFGDDQELGKKDDDHRPGDADDLILSDVLHVQWPLWQTSARTRRRQVVVTLLVFISAVGIILYIAVGHQNSIDARNRHRPRPRPPPPIHHKLEDYQIKGGHASLKQPSIPKPEPKKSRLLKGRPPEPQERDGRELQYFDGPLEWPSLAASLQESSTGRIRSGGQHVLFAAASLQSVARLAPMACEMARWNRNTVHIAIMGRYGLKMEKIKKINGVDASCAAQWHDARPDFAAYSNDKRFNLGVLTGLEHIRNYILPQAILVDERSKEEPEFTRALDKFMAKHDATVINLPVDAVHSLQWINRLDSGALAAWHKANVEILVRAPVGNTGSLMRLLRSLQQADYFGTTPPHLTIELPADLDRHTKQFLDSFVWPPPSEDGQPQVSHLTLRKRLPKLSVSPEDASMRLIESFYPSKPSESHVLLLAPEAELSPNYYHYLIYNLLEYKYSNFHQWSREMQDLLGISLITPSYLLDGVTELNRPKVPVEPKKGKPADEKLTAASPFLWQAPDTYATLYFGDKWKQLHSFFHHRIGRPDQSGGKEVTESLPAFAEYFLELMLARGWYILYPHLPGYEFATAHSESYQPPEEFLSSEQAKDANVPKPYESQPLGHSGPASLPTRKEEHLPGAPLHVLLPDNGDLMELERLPMLSYKGLRLTASSKDTMSIAYTKVFRDEVGECGGSQNALVREDDYSAEDLFCDGESGDSSTSGTYTPGPPVEEQIPEINDKGESNAPVEEDLAAAMRKEQLKHLDRQKDRSG